MSLHDSRQTLGTAIGTSPAMVMFRQGEMVVLQSLTSRSTLCVYEGHVSGKGIRDSYSQFKVHIRPSGKIALQNAANPDSWLGIFEGRTLGSGSGGPYSEFYLKEIEDKYVALESAFYPGQHVSISENGELCPPSKTLPLDRASLFIPFSHSSPSTTALYSTTISSISEKAAPPPPYAGPSTSQDLDTGVMTGATPPSLTPNSCAPLPSDLVPYEPPSNTPQTPQHQGPYNQPDTAPVMPNSAVESTVHTEPKIPIGYEIMDLFSWFNRIVIIPRVGLCGRPLRVVHGVFGHTTLKVGGTYLGNDCEFNPDYSSEGGLILRHHASNGAVFVNDSLQISITKKPTMAGIACEFAVRGVEERYVVFESIKFPGHYINVGKDSVAKLDAHPRGSHKVQFTIRINAFRGKYSHVLMSPFSVRRPSIVNQLMDESVIQLYDKPTMTYLCLGESGNIRPTPKEEAGTFLLFHDRGMGRVSLTGYYRSKLKLRIENNEQFSSLGPDDVNMDFYMKESPSGTLLFQCAAYPSKFLHLHHLQMMGPTFSEFSVFFLDTKKAKGKGRNKTIPKYALN